MPIPAAIAAAIIAGGAQVGSNMIQNRGTKRREAEARRFNQRMERDRRKYDQRMWDKTMAYNHPLAQMERLQKAGLNPNLIYGSSPGSAVGNASSFPTGKQVTGQAAPFRIDNPMIPFMDAQVKQAQTSNIEADEIKKLAEAQNIAANTKKTGFESQYLERTIDKRVQAMSHEETIKRIKAEIAKRTKEKEIKRLFSEQEKAELTVQGLQEALKWQKAGFGGNLLTSVAQSLGFDLRTQVGRSEFKVWAQLAGFLKAGESISNIAKNIVGALNPLKWGKPKAPKGTFIRRY